VSATAPPGPPRPTRTLCFGDPLVDLICQRPVGAISEADAFVPHFGGVAANVAVVAARAGAHVGLAGSAGEDDWGRWLRRRLEDEGVELSMFELVTGRQTPVALVGVDDDGEAAYNLYGEPVPFGATSLGGRLESALEDSAALFITSNTLVGAPERELTMRARDTALALGRPLIFDANVRLHRWGTHADAAASANACVPGALLVKANRAEAELLTGEDDPERAAIALLKGGARLVVITVGARGAILRGELRADVPGVPTEVLSSIGAGDVLTGTLLAKLAVSDFYPPAVAAALPEAVARAARTCERWAALD
jgi:sugar/nucleoside kinase (ribokinase family)